MSTYVPTLSSSEQLQVDLAARLNADPFFIDIPVFVMRPRGKDGFTSLQSEIDNNLKGLIRKNGKAGVAVFVLMPSNDAVGNNSLGPRLERAIIVRCQEFDLINSGATGTRKSCEAIAEKVLQIGHQANFGFGNVIYAAQDAWTPSALADPMITIDVKFLQQTGLGNYSRVQFPAISAAGTLVTITCATSGAPIFYSVDGSYPTLPYTAPFTAASGTYIRAISGPYAAQQQSSIIPFTVP